MLADDCTQSPLISAKAGGGDGGTLLNGAFSGSDSDWVGACGNKKNAVGICSLKKNNVRKDKRPMPNQKLDLKCVTCK